MPLFRLARYGVICLLVIPWAQAALEAQSPQLSSIPEVSLEAMEPAVRAQLEQQQQALEALAQSTSDEALRPSAQQLATAYGELGQLYLLYDLAGPARAALRNAATLAPTDVRWPYLLGTSYELDADRNEAILQYQEALERESDQQVSAAVTAAIKARLARALSEQDVPTQESLDQAQRLYEQLQDASGFQAVAQQGLGQLAAERGDHESAIRLLSEALAVQPAANQLHYQLALSHRELGNLDQARFHLENRGDSTTSFPDPMAVAVQAKAGGAGAMLALGKMSTATGDLETAQDRFERAIELAADNPEGYRALGALHLRRSDPASAIARFEQAVELAPDDARLRHLTAQLLLETSLTQTDLEQRASSVQRATQHLQEVLLLAPNFTEARAALGKALLRLGRFNAADATYREALELDPSEIEWHYRRAEAIAERIAVQAGLAGAPVETWGNAGRASLAAFLSGLADQRRTLSPSTVLEVGLLELRLGDSVSGRQRLAALAADSSTAPKLAARASLLLANEAAQRSAQTAAQSTPNQTSIAALDAEAVQRYQRSLELDPSLAEARFNLATLLGRMKRFGEAASNYEALIANDPRNVTIRISHAVALLLAEQEAKARAGLEQALELMPAESALANLLARILVASEEEAVREPEVGLDLAIRLFEALPTAQHGETVAMALAETGQFDKAVEWQSRVLDQMVEERAAPHLLSVAKRRLDQYQALNPERAPWRLTQ